MKLKDSRGSALMVGLLIFVLLAAGGVGFWVWHKNNSTTSGQNSSSSNSSTNTNQQDNQTASNTADKCGNLTVSEGTSEGTAGTKYVHVVITNNGATACTLSGYPAEFSMTDGTMDQSADHKDLYPTANVTLAANGGKAYVVIGLPDPGNFPTPATECTVASKTKLKLRFEGMSSPIDSDFNESACTGLTVTTIQSGA